MIKSFSTVIFISRAAQNYIGHLFCLGGPYVEEQEKRKEVRQIFDEDSEHRMIYAVPMKFQDVKEYKTDQTEKEYDDEKGLGSTCHYIKGKREQNGHVVNFKLMDLLDPPLQDGIIFRANTGSGYTRIKPLMRLAHMVRPGLLALLISLFWFRTILMEVDQVLDQFEYCKNHEDQHYQKPYEEVSPQHVLKLTRTHDLSLYCFYYKLNLIINIMETKVY